MLHYADLLKSELRHAATVPFTAPGRTLSDCIAEDFAPDLIHQGVAEARRRGLISRGEEAELVAGLLGGVDDS